MINISAPIYFANSYSEQRISIGTGVSVPSMNGTLLPLSNLEMTATTVSPKILKTNTTNASTEDSEASWQEQIMKRQRDSFEKIGCAMLSSNESVLLGSMIRLFQDMTPEARRTFTEKTRTPRNAFGILQDHPLLSSLDSYLIEDRRLEREAVADE
jgi:hypothetical protein